MIIDKPINLGNQNSNAILEQIHQVLGNIVRTYNIKETYLDKDEPWFVILAAAAFITFSTENRLKCYIPSQLLFGRDMILPTKHTAYWELIHQKKKIQINKDNIRGKSKRVNHDYKSVGKVMLNNLLL